MTVKSLKISGWDVNPAQANEGEENAVVVSFRLSNIIGVDYFVKLFKEAKKRRRGYGKLQRYRFGRSSLSVW